MKGYFGNVENLTLENTNFRKVLYTGKHTQLVLMSLMLGEDIGEEIHAENDQFFRIESGLGRCIIDNNIYELSNGVAIIVPAGAKHNIINISTSERLNMYALYSPPHHKDQIIRSTKQEAEINDEEFDGIATE